MPPGRAARATARRPRPASGRWRGRSAGPARAARRARLRAPVSRSGRRAGVARSEIGIGVIGTGFMGAAHALALHAVGPIFEPRLRPRLEVVADIDGAAAERARDRYGFARSTTDWQALVADPAVELVS